jgi:hypothetical protein
MSPATTTLTQREAQAVLLARLKDCGDGRAVRAFAGIMSNRDGERYRRSHDAAAALAGGGYADVAQNYRANTALGMNSTETGDLISHLKLMSTGQEAAK